MSIRFGLSLDFWSATRPLPRLLDEYLEVLKLAEDYGFESVWAGEHRPSQPESGHVPSPLLILTAVAKSTSLRLGTGVTLLPLWHPLQLAYEAALLDQISGGRLTLGVGVGNPGVLKRYGIPPEETASRMDESLALLRAIWAGQDTFQGHHFSVKGKVYPGPVQPGGPPVWVGGKIRRAVERAVQWGDGWYGATQFHLNTIVRQSLRYRQLLSGQTERTSPGTIAVNRTTFLAETDQQARLEGKPYVSQVLQFYGRMGLIQNNEGASLDPGVDLFEAVGEEIYFVGSPERCKDSIHRYHEEAGVNQFNLRVSIGDIPMDLLRRTVILLGERVLPEFR